MTLTKVGFIDEYYEQPQAWGEQTISSREERRINETISLIPEGCSSILDVGCGDGRIINRLVSQYSRVVGLERCKEALGYVKTEKILGSAESLPFPDRSFDLVLCCEVLEHLPFKVYPRVLEEIERVAARYIIVTVPNSENIKQSLVRCPHCGCLFHPSRHLRSFNTRQMQGLFNQFGVRNLRFYRPSEKTYPSFLIRVAKLLRLISVSHPTALCPQCGYAPLADKASPRANMNNKDSPLVRLLRFLARWLISVRKQGGWLMALYHRN